MLLYITAEDVFGDKAPQPRGARPLHSLPATLNALYDMGMRHHLRRAVLLWPEATELLPVPDWKLDRLVIRIALYAREKLGLEPGSRAAVIGRLGWLWPAADFAVQGFGATSVGFEHDVADDALLGALREADPRLIFSTDGSTTARLLELRAGGQLPRVPIVGAETTAAAGELLPVRQLLEMAGTLDTAERAQAFRMICRRAEPEAEALWHVGAKGIERMTHARAMERVAAQLRARPPAAGDVSYLQPPRVTLSVRLALAACVGDGLTQGVLGRDGAVGEDVARLRPHTLRVTADWLEAACRGRGPRWPAGLDRSGARRRLQEALGDRLRLVETDRPLDEATRAALGVLGAAAVSD